jgi:hypothetical protein
VKAWQLHAILGAIDADAEVTIELKGMLHLIQNVRLEWDQDAVDWNKTDAGNCPAGVFIIRPEPKP